MSSTSVVAPVEGPAGADSATAAVAENTSQPPVSWLTLLAAIVLVVGATIGVYWNSLDGVFVLDDHAWIIDNSSIKNLLDLREVLLPTGNVDVTGRPIVSLTLAINYALGGLDPLGYHIVNLAIHVLNALLLLGIVRRTLLSPRLVGRFAAAALPLATAVALIWAVHPLTTAAVTYVIQRTESLAVLFYLLTLYCTIRGATVAEGGKSQRRIAWYIGAAIACALGMATKEIVATAPVLILLYDRTFLSGSFGGALRQRRGLYAALAACWGIVVALLVATNFHNGTTGLAVVDFTPATYLLTECGVIAHYLQLAFWPVGLCLDYGWRQPTRMLEIVPPIMLMVALLGVTAWALVKRPAWGFLGAAFFLILAPSSSVIQIQDAAFDHRMYLPLAALVALVVIGVYSLWTRWFGAIDANSSSVRSAIALALIFVLGGLGWTTVMRNAAYGSEDGLWRDVLATSPQNWRAYASLAWLDEQRHDDDHAIENYKHALELRDYDAKTRLQLGDIYKQRGDIEHALVQFREAVKDRPDSVAARLDFANGLSTHGEFDKAVEQWSKAVELDPESAAAQSSLGNALVTQGKLDEALVHCRKAVELNPRDIGAHTNLGKCFALQGKLDDAHAEFKRTIELDPKFATGYFNLAGVYAAQKKPVDAENAYRQALELAPDDLEIHLGYGDFLMELGGDRVNDASNQFRKVLRDDSENAQAEYNLAGCLVLQGEPDEAIDHYERAVELRPKDAHMCAKLAAFLERNGRHQEAIRQFQRAVELKPDDVDVLSGYAGSLIALNNLSDAADVYKKILKLEPKNTVAENDLGDVFGQQGKFAEARRHFERVVQLRPDDPTAHFNLGQILYRDGDDAAAAAHWRKAVEQRPKELAYLPNLAWLLASSWDDNVRNGKDAATFAETAVELSGGRDANIVAIQAAAEAEAGRYFKAQAIAGDAIRAAEAQKNTALADQIRERLKLYEAGKAYHAPRPEKK